jgi:hypothetical protein
MVALVGAVKVVVAQAHQVKAMTGQLEVLVLMRLVVVEAQVLLVLLAQV